MSDCVFCKIIKDEIPSDKVYENDEIVAFKDINPTAPVQILIIPKTHLSSLSRAKKNHQEVLGSIQVAAAQIAEDKGISNAFKLLTLSGKGAGQEVFHIHYHLLGGWKNKKK